DACPAGAPGTIPVGGVAAARNAIHPGMHSADICCSVMLSDLGRADPGAALDAVHAATHFGPGGRAEGRRLDPGPEMIAAFRANRFLAEEKAVFMATSHLATQGDGNHFAYVGRSEATGRTVLVTHHGSRGPGARLYRNGMTVAEGFRRALSPDTLKQNAWIPADSDEGRAYWDALQIIRRWTRANHTAIHDRAAAALGVEPLDRFWNEHNFVFERDGLYYHGKGATPAWAGFAGDARAETLIPLNMAEPILVVRGRDAPHALGFSPHGAGRNVSRSEHRRRQGGRSAEAIMAAETQGLDIRFWSGRIDVSELPSSYKNATAVTAQIERHRLATIADRIQPYGCLMAGDMPAPWERRRKAPRPGPT
ncbi:MAG: RtcB family protein, partial [Pseudomonadota bacterium]